MSLPEGHWKAAMMVAPGGDKDAQKLLRSDWWMDRFNGAWMVGAGVLLAWGIWDFLKDTP